MTLQSSSQLGGRLPHKATRKSQTVRTHAHKSRVAIVTHRTTATDNGYNPNPGASGVPTFSDGNCSPPSSTTCSCKSGTRGICSPPVGVLPFRVSRWPLASGLLPTQGLPSCGSSLTSSRRDSGAATVLAEWATSGALRSLFAGLDSVVWHGDRQATRSGSSAVQSGQFICPQ